MPALSGKLEPRTRAENAAIAIRQAEAAGRIPVSIIYVGVGTYAMAISAGPVRCPRQEWQSGAPLTPRSYNTLS